MYNRVTESSGSTTVNTLSVGNIIFLSLDNIIHGSSVTLIPTTTFGSSAGNYDGSSASFNGDKVKGDGYYSQTDGLHTVAYHVNATCTGSLKMQGSLATTPTEDDFFDIDGTTFTTDQSTTINSVNFTGNFVWVRSVVTVTTGSVTKIQLNF